MQLKGGENRVDEEKAGEGVEEGQIFELGGATDEEGAGRDRPMDGQILGIGRQPPAESAQGCFGKHVPHEG